MLDQNNFIVDSRHLKKCQLVMDEDCEIENWLWPYADVTFKNFSKHTVIPRAVYVIGRQQTDENKERIRDLVERSVIKVVFSNPAEGASTIENHCRYVYNIADLLLQKKMLMIGGAEMSPEWPCLVFESFLPKIHDQKANVLAIDCSEDIYTKLNKPYKFVFLNGRFRVHRKYLIERFNIAGLLEHSIWSNLDTQPGPGGAPIWQYQGQDLMAIPRPLKFLDPQYEIDRYVANMQNSFKDHFVKHELFTAYNTLEWGDGYLKPDMYIDSYFSVVTETIFDGPYSFRTEKIWKPIAMGHPWIVAANAGYYRDIRNLGFQTFGHVIDESFDQIQNDWDRANRIVEVVEDLCRQDLASFLKECYNVCKYNQQLMIELRPKVCQALPRRFFEFLTKYNFQ